MPREGYTNLTVNNLERLRKIKRSFEMHSTSHYQWIDWVTEVLDAAVSKEKFLKSVYPHLRLVGSIEKGYILEDTQKKQIVEIRVKGGKYTAKPHSDAYIHFAMLHPAIIP